MIREALEWLHKTIQAATPVRFERPAAEPEHVYYLIDADGTHSRYEAEAPPRRHLASDLSAIVAFAKDFGDAYDVEIWCSRTGVVCTLDENRRDRVSLGLQFSAQLLTLLALEQKRTPYDQRGFVRLLRVDLANGVEDNLIAALRYLKFRSGSTGESNLSHGKASIGKSLEAEITGNDAIPEEVFVSVPIWHGFRSYASESVRCDLEIDAQAERFFLTPMPGEIEAAIRRAEDGLGQQLEKALKAASAQASLYYGTP